MKKAVVFAFTLIMLSLNGCATFSPWTKENYAGLANKNFSISKISFTVPSSLEPSPYLYGQFISTESEEMRKFSDSLYNAYYWHILEGLPLDAIKRKIESEKGIVINIDEAEKMLVQKNATLAKTDEYYQGRSYTWQNPADTKSENVVEIEFRVCNLMQCNGGNSLLSLTVLKGAPDQRQRLNRYSSDFNIGFALLIANLEGRERILNAMNGFVKNVANSLAE